MLFNYYLLYICKSPIGDMCYELLVVHFQVIKLDRAFTLVLSADENNAEKIQSVRGQE